MMYLLTQNSQSVHISLQFICGSGLTFSFSKKKFNLWIAFRSYKHSISISSYKNVLALFWFANLLCFFYLPAREQIEFDICSVLPFNFILCGLNSSEKWMVEGVPKVYVYIHIILCNITNRLKTFNGKKKKLIIWMVGCMDVQYIYIYLY